MQNPKTINFNQFCDKFPTEDWNKDVRYITDEEWEKFVDCYECANGWENLYTLTDGEKEYTYDEYYALPEDEQAYIYEEDNLEGAYQFFVITKEIAQFIMKYSDYPLLTSPEVGYVLPIYWYGLSWSMIEIEVDNKDNLW